jgi:uncharacterized protein (TIGR03086 family)
MDLPSLHDRALSAVGAYVAGIGEDQWHNDTPCEDWDVRRLVEHLVVGNVWVEPLVAGETIEQVGDRFDGDVLGDDPVAAYTASAESARAAFHREGAMEAPCAVSYGPVPGEIYAGHRLIDLVVHGWDVAEATGQSTALDPELVDAAWSVIEPQLEMLVGSGMFGTTIEVPPDAPAQTRLLAALGRRG